MVFQKPVFKRHYAGMMSASNCVNIIIWILVLLLPFICAFTSYCEWCSDGRGLRRWPALSVLVRKTSAPPASGGDQEPPRATRPRASHLSRLFLHAAAFWVKTNTYREQPRAQVQTLPDSAMCAPVAALPWEGRRRSVVSRGTWQCERRWFPCSLRAVHCSSSRSCCSSRKSTTQPLARSGHADVRHRFGHACECWSATPLGTVPPSPFAFPAGLPPDVELGDEQLGERHAGGIHAHSRRIDLQRRLER